MKYWILLIFPLFALNTTVAAVDLSGLQEKVSRPTVKTIKKQFAEFKKTIAGMNLNPDQKSALIKLEESMKIQRTPATLYRKKSRGPKWKKQAIDHIEKEHDLHELISYIDEEGRASEFCGFVEGSDIEEDGYRFAWFAIKKKTGSQKSIAYIVEVVVDLTGTGKNGKSKKCEYVATEYAFDGKLTQGKPIQIGL